MASSSSSYVPKGQQGLLLRTPLTFGFAPTTYDPASSSPAKTQTPMDGGTPKKVGFYTRNNPHPGRVRHIKGLLDFPICSVEDNSPEMRLLSPPSGRDFGPPYRPSGGTRYGSNRTKGIPAVGVVPVTYAWRNELEIKAHQAISRAMGQPPPSRGGVMSRGGSRMQQQQRGTQFGHLQDDQILELLCKILQTDSIPTCQAWLASASDTEKNIVLNMIRMAATGEIDANPSSTRPQTHESQYRYVWSPEQSHMRKSRAQRSDPTHYFSDEETEFDFSYGAHFQEQYPDEEYPNTTAFKFPEHDTVVQTARQLANLASRQSSRGQRTRSLDMSQTKTHGFLSEGGHQMQARPLSHRSSSAHHQSRPHHSRSTSLTAMGQTSTGSASHRRARSRSATATHTHGNDSQYPPPPVRVSVTKEKLRDGSASGKARLRYTSHWET